MASPPRSARAFERLKCMVAQRARVVTKDVRLQVVWPGRLVEESYLRKLLQAQTIATARGRGCRFMAPASGTPPPAKPLSDAGAPVMPSLAVLPFAKLSED